MNVLSLYARLSIAIALMFAVIYALIAMIAYIFGIVSPIIYALIAFLVIIIQYAISPKIVEITMGVKYIDVHEMPWLHEIVEKLAMKAGIKKPRIGISNISIPNAFAFGRSVKDGRVCVTKGLLNILNREEIEAVLGHEISHIKHRDMILLTIFSAIPLMSYYIFWTSLWSRDRRNNGVIVAMVAFLTYILTNIILLYINRIREYYADYGSAMLTEKPHNLASALYRITLATSRLPAAKIKEAEGMKAFFATDPSKARRDIVELSKADLNMDGHLDEYEVKKFASVARPTVTEKIMEIFSSHPNVVDRIRKLAEIK